METLKVHSPHRTSLHVIALKGLLMLRKQEQWSWVPSQVSADVWVLDALKSSDAELNHWVQEYQSCTSKPVVVYLTDGKKEVPHDAWLSIRAPVHVTKFFRLLDDQLSPHTSIDVCNTQTTKHEWVFDRALLEARRVKLKQWPNITRYGHELKYVQACAFLLASDRGYAELKQLNLTDAELTQLLGDAHKQNFLMVQPPLDEPVQTRQASSNVIPFQPPSRLSASVELKGFFRKMMKRFALS